MQEGLAALFAYRLAQLGPITFTLAANDYGFELLSGQVAVREIARVAGLIFQGYPGNNKSVKQVRRSSWSGAGWDGPWSGSRAGG